MCLIPYAFAISLQHFDENELEWLIGGLPTIDTADWCVA